VESTDVDVYLPPVIVSHTAIDDLGNRDVLRLGFSLDAGNERLFDVEGPALRGSRGVIGLGQEVLAPAPPGKPLLKVSEIGEGEIDVDVGGSLRVDIGGATGVRIRGLDW
jgi:hypothetical protein